MRAQLSDWRPVFANRDAVALRDGGQEFGEMGLGLMDVHLGFRD